MSGADVFGQRGVIGQALRLSLTPGSDPILGNVFTKQSGIITPTGNFSQDSWQRMRQDGNQRALNALSTTNQIADVIAPMIAGGYAGSAFSGAAGAAASGAGEAAGAAGSTAGAAGSTAGGAMGTAAPGMAGGLGSGMYAVPLSEGGMMIGQGGMLAGEGVAAGEIGSGLAGVTMPTAAETVGSPWYIQAMDAAKTGAKYANKAEKVRSALTPKQQQQVVQARPIYQGEYQQISPFGDDQGSQDMTAMLMQRRLRKQGLLR